MRFVHLCVAIALATALTAKEPPATWRLDFYHTGGLGTEIFSLDRVVVEPLPWPGHPDGALDLSESGDYRYSVRDLDGTVRFSRGFSSIFAEWESSAAALERHRTFHESLRFPAPADTVHVIVEKRIPGTGFREVWRYRLDPADPFIERAAPAPQAVLPIVRNGDPADHLDILFLGDGYTAEENDDAFAEDARRMAATLFAFEPFRGYREAINIWGICPPSPASGISRPSTGIHLASPIGATYDAFGSERYILTFENRRWREIAAWAPYEFVVILVNNETYGGGGIFNLYATVAVKNPVADYLFIHEFGHHFAGLADEYYISPTAYLPPDTIHEPWMANATALLDPEKLKWKDLVTADTPIPTPWPQEAFDAHGRAIQQRREQIRAENRPEEEMSALFAEQAAWETALLSEAEYAGRVGAFSGANYDAKAYYRPEIDCVMFSRNAVPFCAVCERAMRRVIERSLPGR